MPLPTSRTESLVHAALQFHQQGDPAQAEPLYRQALALAPNDPGILNLLGIALLQQTRIEEAETLLLKAVSFDKRNPELYNSLGSIQQALGKHEQAMAAFRKTVSLNPRHAQAYFNLGNTLLASGKISEACVCYRKTLTLSPDHPEALNNLGSCLLKLGRPDEAENCCRKAAEGTPDYAMAHYNLGNILLAQDKPEAATASFRRAVKLAPHAAIFHNNLGSALQKLDRPDEAIACFREAIRLDPRCAEANASLGAALHEQGNDDAALSQLDLAETLAPGHPDIYYNRGHIAQHRGQLADAIANYRRALEIAPEYADARKNLAIALLVAGNLPEGWEKFQYLSSSKNHEAVLRPFTQPCWQNESLSGKTILAWGWQGVGDEILFVGLIPDLARQAGHIVLECKPKLAPLFARSFPSVEVIPCADPPHPRTRQPDIDFQLPVEHSARWLRPTLEHFPEHGGYLAAAPERVALWKDRLDALDANLKVGVSWRSKLIDGKRKKEYASLDAWGAVFSLPGITFINLQYDECAAELADARERFGVEIHAFSEVNLFDDLDEAAALTKALDVVISPATSVAFMAGALDVPVLQFGMAFAYWECLGTDRFPWFPSMTLFNRRWDEGWEGIFQKIAEVLRERAMSERARS